MFRFIDRIHGIEINDSPYKKRCRYCNSGFITTEIEDVWHVSNDDIINVHEDTVKNYKKHHNLAEHYLNLNLSTANHKAFFQYCWTCGWWRLLKRVRICAETWQVWEMFFGCAGCLKNLDLVNINSPLNEIRDFITKNYEKRLNINPKLFENLVASVFKSLGYNVLVTGYTHDGGIDIVLDSPNSKKIGVQVKRHKSAIKLEQIRAFAGALLLNNLPDGIFITTSSFTQGALNVTNQLSDRGISIKLIDAPRFYNTLKIAQIYDKSNEFMPFSPCLATIPHIEYYGWHTPMNSL